MKCLWMPGLCHSVQSSIKCKRCWVCHLQLTGQYCLDVLVAKWPRFDALKYMYPWAVHYLYPDTATANLIPFISKLCSFRNKTNHHIANCTAPTALAFHLHLLLCLTTHLLLYIHYKSISQIQRKTQFFKCTCLTIKEKTPIALKISKRAKYSLLSARQKSVPQMLNRVMYNTLKFNKSKKNFVFSGRIKAQHI